MKTLEEIKLFILDLDGTIYLSDELIPGAKEFLEGLKERGINRVFLTNNSSRSAKAYVEKLENLGLEVTEDEIMTSGKATVLYLQDIAPRAKIFLMGTPSLEKEFIDGGFHLVRSREETPDFVVFGFDQTLTYDKVHMACDFILDGAGYIATHPDINCPLAGGKFMIDTGAFIKAIEASINRVPDVIIGKPSPYIYNVIQKSKKVKQNEMVMVGDRLYTDIQGAKDSGIYSILVFSGETTKKSYDESEVKADFHYESVIEILKDL